jgi:glycosyltransferase involved in cell wall biosynthesis
MKIAIYHNLNAGGALFQIKKLIEFTKEENEIHIFSPNNNLSNLYLTTHHYYKTTDPRNITEHLIHGLFELSSINKNIAKDIDSGIFDVVYVFPCYVTQSPDVLRFLKHKSVIYFFAERKREFSEKTSFDHYTIKRVLTRALRFPIFLKDYINCIHATRIITNSIYSKNVLKKTYRKESKVIYPGLKQTTPKAFQVKNTDKAIIVGQLSYIKGYDIAINLLRKSGYKEVSVVGRKTNDFNFIKSYSKKLGVKINLLETESDNEKDAQYKKHGVFIACQRKEPFGITTLEACYNNNIVIGLNEGGTPEIIHHGLNGLLFNTNDLEIVAKILSKIRKLKKINILKVNTIDWKLMAKQITSIQL